MDDLAAFYAARLGEQEATARELMRGAQDAQLALEEPRLLGREIPEWWRWPDVEAMAAHMLREVQAGRKILALYESRWAKAYENAMEEDRAWTFAPVIAILAAAWSGHPDYKPEWG